MRPQDQVHHGRGGALGQGRLQQRRRIRRRLAVLRRQSSQDGQNSGVVGVVFQGALQASQLLGRDGLVGPFAVLEPADIRGGQGLMIDPEIGQLQAGRQRLDGVLVAALQQQGGRQPQPVPGLRRGGLEAGPIDRLRLGRRLGGFQVASGPRVQAGQVQLVLGPCRDHLFQLLDRLRGPAARSAQLAQQDSRLELVRRAADRLAQVVLEHGQRPRCGRNVLAGQVLGEPEVGRRIAGSVLGRDLPHALTSPRQILLPLGGQGQPVRGGRRVRGQLGQPAETDVGRGGIAAG